VSLSTLLIILDIFDVALSLGLWATSFSSPDYLFASDLRRFIMSDYCQRRLIVLERSWRRLSENLCR